MHLILAGNLSQCLDSRQPFQSHFGLEDRLMSLSFRFYLVVCCCFTAITGGCPSDNKSLTYLLVRISMTSALDANYYFALFVQIVHLPDFPAFAQPKYPMKHLFGNHKCLTIIPFAPLCILEVAMNLCFPAINLMSANCKQPLIALQKKCCGVCPAH